MPHACEDLVFLCAVVVFWSAFEPFLISIFKVIDIASSPKKFIHSATLGIGFHFARQPA